MFSREFLYWGVLLAGWGQIALCVGTLALPKILRWREKLAVLDPLERQMFLVYAGYIWCTNLSFGLLSALAPGSLLDGSTLAAAVSGFIAAYWGARVALQFGYLDLASARPPGKIYVVAEVVLDLLFVGLTLGYAAVCWWNLFGSAGDLPA